jgi:hypothetical protein
MKKNRGIDFQEIRQNMFENIAVLDSKLVDEKKIVTLIFNKFANFVAKNR